ncbi:MAG: uroporphyrinogen decarboxylase family protein [Armatimonadota bacterium]|nr:uroporphyrinogen decarboxylase family protein [Armatimonadota bacterium]
MPEPQTPREVVRRTVTFSGPDRLARSLPPPYGDDFAGVGMTPSPDARPSSGVDEWGAVWHNIGVSKMGEVKEFPLQDWSNFSKLQIPDIHDPRRWTALSGARERAGDRFLMATGISLYERVHFIRGLENTWADLYTHPAELRSLLNILVDMNLAAIAHYAQAGADGYMWCDDWGLQNRLMISPEKWREFWKPCYARVYEAAHAAGMLTFLHSCGYIVDILDDLIEIGLDVIQMDQQENMGLELLSERFAGRITFYCPVDIQQTMAHGSPDEIRAYCRRMVRLLGRPEGGFIAKWYSDPVGAGHRPEAITAMCEEFLAISQEIYGRA